MPSFRSTVNTSDALKLALSNTGAPGTSCDTGEKLNWMSLYAGPGLKVFHGSWPTKKSCENAS